MNTSSKTYLERRASIIRRALEHVSLRGIQIDHSALPALADYILIRHREQPNWRLVLRIVEAIRGEGGA